MSPIPDATRTPGLKRKEQGLSTLLLYVSIVCRRGALPCDTAAAAGSTQTPSLQLPLWAASKAEISLDSGWLPPVSAALTYPMASTFSRWAAICHRHHAPCGKKFANQKCCECSLLGQVLSRPAAIMRAHETRCAPAAFFEGDHCRVFLGAGLPPGLFHATSAGNRP